MTPTSALDVVAAKMVPVFVLLMGMVALVLTLARLVFGVPFRGGMWFFVTVSALCVLTGISIGTLGVEVMYPEVLSPLASTVVLVGVSIWRFRRELGCGPRGGDPCQELSSPPEMRTTIMSMSKTVCTSRFRAKALHTTRRLVNALVLLVAGTRVFPLYGVIKHPGRRWGAVVARATRDRFVVPMPWGESTDWHRNVRAAGECIVRWKGRDYPVRPPEVMEVAAAKVSVGAVARTVMMRLGITLCLRLRYGN